VNYDHTTSTAGAVDAARYNDLLEDYKSECILRDHAESQLQGGVEQIDTLTCERDNARAERDHLRSYLHDERVLRQQHEANAAALAVQVETYKCAEERARALHNQQATKIAEQAEEKRKILDFVRILIEDHELDGCDEIEQLVKFGMKERKR
jgi:hypothetical protein